MDDLDLPSPDQSIHVWLIDDNEVYRGYVREACLNSTDRILLTEFSSCEQTIQHIPNNITPQVILLDISLPGGMSGLMGLQLFNLKLPQSSVIMVTASEENDSIYEAFCRGAKGYVVKSSLPEKIIEAIKDALEGRIFIDSHIAGKILRAITISSEIKSKYNLTPTETKILEMFCERNSRKEVLNKLFIAETTLKYHLQNIYQKLQVHRINEAMAVYFSKK